MNQLELHLIINKNAGSGTAAKSSENVITQLSKKHIPFFEYVTEYQGHAVEIATNLKKNVLQPWSKNSDTVSYPLLVVLGGDGTLHEVINALGESFDIPVGYIPCGSGNDFARGVKLDRNPLIALEHLLEVTEPSTYNIIHYKEAIQEEFGYFTNNIGIGVDAAIVAKANESKSKKALNKFKMGAMTYLSAASSVVFEQKGFPLMVELNGQTIEFDHAYLCTTTNHPYFGGGVAIAPDADPKRSDMELIIVERIHLVKILYLITLVLRKKHLRSKHVHHYKSNAIRIVSTTSQFGQADGEVMGHRPFDISFTTSERLFWL